MWGSLTGKVEEYFLTSVKAKGVVVICPGGGYRMLASFHEGEMIANYCNDHGYHAVVLHYSVGENQQLGYRPVKEVIFTIATLRKHADKLKISTNHIAVWGFSAGGHLAASAGTLWDLPIFHNQGKADRRYRPDAMILCYPVISATYPHCGSYQNLVGDNPDDWEQFSLEQKVNSNTPPAFLWHTAEDTTVSVENSLLFSAALARNNISFELHIYPYGHHGLGMAVPQAGEGKDFPHVAGWIELAIRWLDQEFLSEDSTK